MDRAHTLITGSNRPLLICGEPGTGRTAMAKYLAVSHRDPITIIDPTSVSYADVVGPRNIIPNDFPSDSAFYQAATQAVFEAMAADAGVLVIDDFDILAAPYRERLASQERFLGLVTETIARASEGHLLVIVAARQVPDQGPTLEMFGPRLVMGTPTDAVWPLMLPGHGPIVLDPGHGLLFLDGRIEKVALPSARIVR